MKKLLLLVLGCALYGAGTVTQSVQPLGSSGNYAVTFYWTGDSANGSVPVTAANLGPASAIAQGYRLLQVETAPGTPSPTSGYSVKITDAIGIDMMGGQMASLSASAAQIFAASTATPPINGTFSLTITGQSSGSAKGTVVVYFGPTTLISATAGTAGPQGPAGPAGTGLYTTNSYRFTAQTLGAISAGIANTVTLSPVPIGLNATDTNHQLYISGCSGGNQTVTITGGTAVAGSASGTIVFTPVNSCTAGAQIQTATDGFQEAEVDAPTGSVIFAPGGSHPFYGTVYVDKSFTWKGGGPYTQILGQFTNIGFFNVNQSYNTFDGFYMGDGSGGQTSGGYGIQLTRATAADNMGAIIENCIFANLWNAIVAVKASNWTVQGNLFDTFRSIAITVANSNTPDSAGPSIINNNFTIAAQPGSGNATAAINIGNTGAITISGNKFNGYMNFAINLAPSASSGLLISNNDIENIKLYSILLSGTYARVTITGNTISQFNIPADPTAWVGILVSGVVIDGTITGNAIQGSTGASNTCIQFSGATPQNWVISGNDLAACPSALYVATGTNIVVGQNSISASATPLTSLTTGALLLQPTTVNRATLGGLSAANGSQLYVTDTNATCNGAGTGNMCFYVNGAWAH